MRLTLLIPHLLWPEPGDKAALEKLPCPGLEGLLARASFRREDPLASEHALARLFGLGADTPFGPLRLFGERQEGAAQDAGLDAGQGFWLCADPVHLRFHHERIVLADAGAFELDLDEARTLADSLNKEFADLGCFHVAETRRWYLRLDTPAEYSPPPLSAVAGRRIDGDLSGNAGESRLRSRLNEIQMYLHGHPLNARRTETGKPAVNSLWLWGAGALPRPAGVDFDGVWAADPLARGLAGAAGIPAHARPRRLADLLGHAAPDGHHLVLLDALLPPVLYEDSRAWRQELERLEEDWFAPLAAGPGRQVASLAIVAPTVYGLLTWESKAADRWKFWRRPRPLAALAGELA